MEFVLLSQLKELSGYRDRRSVKRWAASLGLTLHKVGKNWCVVKIELDNALHARYVNTSVQTIPILTASAQESAFLSDLQNFLAEV